MQLPSTPYDIAASIPFDHFGALLMWLRDRHGFSQKEIIAHLPETISQQRYSSFEHNTRRPQFDDLPAIYQALKDAGVRLTLRDRELFLQLARQCIEAKRTHKARGGQEEWDELRRKLAETDTYRDGTPSGQVWAARAIPLLRMEVSHLVGREAWLDALSQEIAERQVKWVVLQGPPGVGKTSELHRIASYFQSYVPRHYVVLCKLPAREQETLSAETTLEFLLSEIVGGIRPTYVSMPGGSIEVRVKYTLDCLARADRPVLVLLDNAEQALDEQNGQLSPIWLSFYERFMHVRHHTCLVFATQQWPVQFAGEAQWARQVLVPALTENEGVYLLQKLGLAGLPEELLGQVVQAVGGIPACLEWVARLVEEPILHSDWSTFEEDEEIAPGPGQEKAQRLARLLEDASLFGGPVATRVAGLLDRVLRHLSTEALSALQELALASVPLGGPALKVLYHSPLPIQELHAASLLAASPKRVQILPMVAATIRARLSSQQQKKMEERLADALLHWLQTGRTLDIREMGSIVAAIGEIYLKHHRLLDAAEFVIRHGWLSFKWGHARRLAQVALQSIEETKQHADGQLDIQQQCGDKLLSYFLAPFLGHKIDAGERMEDYRFIHRALLDDVIALQPLTEIYLVRNLVAYMVSPPSEEGFEEARALFSLCREHVASFASSDPDCQAALNEVYAFLLARLSDFAQERGESQRAVSYREDAVALYQEACALLTALAQSPLPSSAASMVKKRLAKLSTNLGYQLNRLGRYEEALPHVERGLALKDQGYVEPGSLASSYGEKSQTLASLGRYEEALYYDALAVEDIERLARAGDTVAQEERWIYLVNRASLYLRLQRVDEAESLLRTAIPNVMPTRRKFAMLAEQTLREIEAWRANAPSGRYQRDWRWIGHLREAISFNAFWWLAHAGPFMPDEQRRWQSLVALPTSEDVQKQLEAIVSQSRQRELEKALAERREPFLWYPAIPLGEVQARIERLRQLDADISRGESNETIRDLYHGRITEEVDFLHLIEAARQQDRQRFWEYNQRLHPIPSQEEMWYALDRIKSLAWQGAQREESRGASEQVLALLREELQIAWEPGGQNTAFQDEQVAPLAGLTPERRFVSARTAQRFFEAVLREGNCNGWQVLLDSNASSPRVEAASRLFILPERMFSLDECKALLQHEVLSHIADAVAGEQSPLGLLAVGTRNYMPVSEGLALYLEMQEARASGRAFDDSKVWLGALCTGLAGGVGVPAQSFLSLYRFLTAFLTLYRLLRRPDEDQGMREKRVQSLAQTLCLRTFRGVPHLQQPGVCYSKDVCYLRGVLLIERAVAQDPTIIDRLSIGRTALEYLPAIERLGVAPSLQSIRKRAHDTAIDAYIVSFEQEPAGPSQMPGGSKGGE